MWKQSFSGTADDGFSPEHPELLAGALILGRASCKAPATTGGEKKGSNTHARRNGLPGAQRQG
ncbi:hypothetical protein AA0229_2288 [Gluconobacter cerinus NRIC 0229]|uniref:Transposase n=1 Tax=Gluconobacter cerinus TaxID=38307 RepID=A0AAV5NEP1_9PROT|nr:hypothetical protein AA0229_2288 [Gluconobacter cerinus NRIC 0229]GLQ62387.1 hypothetical protein GCM10007867_12320 [Gluconobacter cerinus]